ncbi:hypothetical protein [Actinophytocola gossypii]|uniref:PPE domain-containing protein n=1 Tax=Actinophytocola gossypii TaxID=2812003 RepID=A0ABT2J3E7_9PSEU|nr:hypothetical protein [Actinophytocola gossypii]MCT2582373.1 hypothetical protein [Actinophytocola gossypii]
MSGDAIYRNFQEGKGPAGLTGGADMVSSIAKTYSTRAKQIRRLAGRMESAWQGQAAGFARRGAEPLAAEHEQASMALSTAQDLTGRQAGSFSEAKGRVVPVPPKPKLENPMQVLVIPGAVFDHEQQVDEHSVAAQNNVDVMNGYSGASAYNITNLPGSYGTLSDDLTGIGIGIAAEGTTTGSAGSAADTEVGSRGFGGSTGPRMGGGNPTPVGASVDGPGHAVPDAPDAGTSHAGSATPGRAAVPGGTTTPETFVPGQPVSPAEPGAARVPGATTGGPAPGLGVVATGPDGAPSSPRGGFGGRGFGSGGPGSGFGARSGAVPGGPAAGVGAEPHGSGTRSGPAAGPLAAAGRGGATAGGFPMGASGRGRDGEDTEHKRPEWLEGGDPDELFDTDVLTAPPTIGDEDD